MFAAFATPIAVIVSLALLTGSAVALAVTPPREQRPIPKRHALPLKIDLSESTPAPIPSLGGCHNGPGWACGPRLRERNARLPRLPAPPVKPAYVVRAEAEGLECHWVMHSHVLGCDDGE
jgi:hypothetical protein